MPSEVHTDALSRDQPERMPFASVRHALRRVSVAGRTVLALGYDHMLRHVARPSARTEPRCTTSRDLPDALAALRPTAPAPAGVGENVPTPSGAFARCLPR